MPPLEIHILGYTLVPNPFWMGALFPLVVFAILYLWPAIGRRWLGDDGRSHNVLDRPRDNPRRTAAFYAFLSWVFLVFAAGSADRLFLLSTIPYEGQVWAFRVMFFVLPPIVYYLTKRVCEELRDRGEHPLRGWSGAILEPTPSGGWEPVARPETQPVEPGAG
jgi:ubiquinol-cytochrome c reductase cytochrome b subunit